MPANTFTPFQNLPPYGVGMPGAVPQGGGGGTPQPFFRSAMDARLSMFNNTPESTYPDGYLGTIRSRREDRMLNALSHREGDRAYTRGVHKGERIDPGDYRWPQSFQPTRGLVAEAAGMRQTPASQLLHIFDPKTEVMRDTEVGIGDARRSAALRQSTPPWR